MSAGRKRKKAARQKSPAQWRATTTALPVRAEARPIPHPNGSTTPTATTPLARPDPVDEPLATPVARVRDPDAAPRGAVGRASEVPREGADRGAADPPAVVHESAPVPPDALEDQYDWEDRHRDDPPVGDAGRKAEDGAPPARSRRHRMLAVTVGAPLIFVGAFAATGWALNAAKDEPLRVGPPVAPPSTAPTASARVSPTTPGESAYVPGDQVGPGLTEPGAMVRAAPAADGSFEVVERVRFAIPVTELSVGPPLTKGVVARSLPSDVAIVDLQVKADTAVLDIGERVLARARTVELPGPTSTVMMRYRLTGATVRSIPSTPGRALSVLPPITSPASLGSMPFVIEVSGDRVTNVLCPALPAAAQLCGRTWTQGWYLGPQPAGRTAVLAQLNLPDPGNN
jgi:hypothetical protein